MSTEVDTHKPLTENGANNMIGILETLDKTIDSSEQLSDKQVLAMGLDPSDGTTVTHQQVTKTVRTVYQDCPSGMGTTETVIRTKDKRNFEGILGTWVAEGLDRNDFSTIEVDGDWHILTVCPSAKHTAEYHRNTINKMGMYDGDEGMSVSIMRGSTRRKDYDKDCVAAIAEDQANFTKGIAAIGEDANHIELRAFENAAWMPRGYRDVGDHEQVCYGDCAENVRIEDDEGPLKGKWRVVADYYASGSHGDAKFDVKWFSNPIVPTLKNVVTKLNRFLKDSGDHHVFLEVIYINHKYRLLSVAMGS